MDGRSIVENLPDSTHSQSSQPRLPWRVAVLSDPHGDLIALQKVVEHLELTGPVDEVLLGGDLAQGGAQPAEVVDMIRERGWSSVRGNSDDLLVRLADGYKPEEALREAAESHESLPESLVSHALWSVQQLGPERIEYLRSLPMSITRGPFDFGAVVLVHATPWSTEDVVLPDADAEVTQRMVLESGARLLLYGHIHTQYVRSVGDATLASVGAVSGSNDADSRPAYMIVDLAETVRIEPRRVDWQDKERLAAYRAAGVEERFSRHAPGPFPCRCEPGTAITVWARS